MELFADSPSGRLLTGDSILLNRGNPIDADDSERIELPSADEGTSVRNDLGFDECSLQSSNTSSVPPRGDEIDRWQRHISLQNFAKELQNAAKCIFPNEARSRYSKVYVLILKWRTEDPNLPVSYEISELRKVLVDIYHYDVELFEIPEIRSHAKVSEEFNSFISINDDSKDDLKIVYYAGHSRLSKTKDLVWSSWQNKRHVKCSTVTWTGIQQALEQAQSDVLILLDCCSSGIGDAGEGNGVTELISACAFDIEANGVGHYSFTKALTIELRLLSKKSCFSVGELYTHIYCRAQHHMVQGIDNEHYPAPIHLQLTRDDLFPRSIQLSIHAEDRILDNCSELGTSNCAGPCAEVFQGKHHLAKDSSQSSNKRARLSKVNQDYKAEEKSAISPYLSGLQTDSGQNGCHIGDASTRPVQPQEESSSQSHNSAINDETFSETNPMTLLSRETAPRLLFAIRFEDDLCVEDLLLKFFADWLRSIPGVAKEVIVEAAFKCDSTLVIVALPLAIWPYLPQHSAIIPLGPVRSTNLLAARLGREISAMSQSSFTPFCSSEKAKGKSKVASDCEMTDTYSEGWLEAAMMQGVADDKGDFSNPVQALESERQSPPSHFEVSGPAIIYVRNIFDKFPHAETRLVERLGEANWQRHVKIRNYKEVKGVFQVVPQEAARSVFQPVSIFHDSGFGSIRSPRSEYAASLSTYISTVGDENSDYFRVPPTPVEVADHKPFECFICGRVISHVKNRVDWKLHVFTDIRPYICTFSSCKDAFWTFARREEWAQHEFKHHERGGSWSCPDCPTTFKHLSALRAHLQEHDSASDLRLSEKSMPPVMVILECPLCKSELGYSKSKYVSHVGKHMESIALAVLPKWSDEFSDFESNDSIPDPEERDTGRLSDVSPAEKQAEAHDNPAKSRSYQGDSKRAEGEILDTFEGHFGPPIVQSPIVRTLRPNPLDALDTRKDIVADLFQMEEPEEIWLSALEHTTNTVAQQRTHTPMTLTYTEDGLKQQASFAEAEKIHQRALEVFTNTLEPQHPMRLQTLVSLAGAVENQGRFKEAEEMYGCALEGYTNTLGRWHINSLQTLASLAGAVQKQGRFKEAEEMYGRALEGYANTLGQHHLNSLQTLVSLARALSYQRQFKEAEEMYGRALEGYTNTLGRWHLDSLQTLASLAGVVQIQGRFKEAEKMYGRALEGYTNTLGRQHLHSLQTLASLAGAVQKQGRFEAAGTMYRRAVEDLIKTRERKHLSKLQALFSLSGALQHQGDFKQAGDLYRTAFEHLTKSLRS